MQHSELNVLTETDTSTNRGKEMSLFDPKKHKDRPSSRISLPN